MKVTDGQQWEKINKNDVNEDKRNKCAQKKRMKANGGGEGSEREKPQMK